MPRRIEVGVVKSDKMSKTRRVEIPRAVRHPLYGKIMHGRTICYVHDEENLSHRGDTVEIEESPPISKLKRWRLVRIVSKSREVQLSDFAAVKESIKENARQAKEAASK